MTRKDPSKKVNPDLKKIMIVDDDDEVRNMLQSTLELEGFQVATARDSSKIVPRALEFLPNLIVTDMMMPGGGGYELVNSLQGEEVTRHIPVIIMTGYNFDSSTKDMMTQLPNVKALFNKPIHPSDLKMKVHELLNTLSREERLINEQNQNFQEAEREQLKKFEDRF